MDFTKYSKHKDKFDSLYTIILNNCNKEEIIKYLYDKLDKLKNVKDITRRKYINNRLFSLITYFKTNKYEKPLSSIVLLGIDINEIKLTKKDKNTLTEYSLPKIIFKNDKYFDVEYLTSLFNNFKFYNIIKVKK